MKLIPEETRIQQINALPNIQFVRWEGEYRNGKTKAVCRCLVDGYEWASQAHSLTKKGTGCPQCAGKRRWTAEERIAQINKLPNIQFVRWGSDYKNVFSKAICRCAVDGFEWPSAVGDLINSGTGCPQCSGHRRWTAEERIAQINAKSNIKFVRWVDGYVDSFSKAVCRCLIDGHEWANTANNLINKDMGCLICSRGAMRLPAEERVAQINALPNISFIRWESGYGNAHSRAVCRCSIDGHEWVASISNLTNNGSGCPKCAGKMLRTSEECEQKINERPNIAFVRWVSEYQNCESKALCRCAIDGFEWSASVVSLTTTGTGCPKCAGTLRKTPEECEQKINELPNIAFVRWADEYRNKNSKAVVRCAVDGFEWPASVESLLNAGRGCPECAEYGYKNSKPGTLYILRSECGSMVKIGISNDHQRRHVELKRATPFDWSCIELLHSTDGSLIAEFEKELHSFTSPAFFDQPFDGYTEWRKWDDRLPRWIERYRARLARIVAP